MTFQVQSAAISSTTRAPLQLPRVRFHKVHSYIRCSHLNTAGFISGDPISFVSRLSERLAEFAPQLTLDFIHEVSAAMTGMDKACMAQRITCLQYMSPWIQNLSHFANATHPLYERSGARLRDCIRTLADFSLAFPEVCLHIYPSFRTYKADRRVSDNINYSEAYLGRSSQARFQYCGHNSG